MDSASKLFSTFKKSGGNLDQICRRVVNLDSVLTKPNFGLFRTLKIKNSKRSPYCIEIAAGARVAPSKGDHSKLSGVVYRIDLLINKDNRCISS